jgi:hypothetical protein
MLRWYLEGKTFYTMRVAHSAVQNAAINHEKLTKNVAWLMQIHSGSSNMVPFVCTRFEAFLGSSWPDDW